MNEIQIIRHQLQTERRHFAEVAEICQRALAQGRLDSTHPVVRACADYFAFATTRLRASPSAPTADASRERWHEFLHGFGAAAEKHFALLDQQEAQLLGVADWRARFPVDADSIVTERARYEGVKATVP